MIIKNFSKQKRMWLIFLGVFIFMTFSGFYFYILGSNTTAPIAIYYSLSPSTTSSNEGTYKLLPSQKDILTLSSDYFYFMTEPLITEPTMAEISYIQYKLNDLEIVTLKEAPFDFEVPSEMLYPGLNYLKVVVFLVDSTTPYIQEVFLDFSATTSYPSKHVRSTIVVDTPSYPVHIPVLMYHKFLDTVEEGEESIAVSTSLFEAQLQMLLAEGYTPIHFSTLFDYLESAEPLPEKPIILTSDDGYLCNYENAYPLLKKYNIPATFFITTAYVGINLQNPHFTWEQAKEMEESGLIDIQSHSHTHRAMNSLSGQELLYEANLSFQLIESYLGERDVKVFSYPQFRHNRNTLRILSEYGVDLQVTQLVKRFSKTNFTSVERIHVSNDTSPEDLIKEIEKATKR